ncbi:MAG: DUF7289 family protein [Methanosarcinales archaeon]
MIREADEDGVTETIGFIFIFGIVILSMSLIYAMGYPQLQSNMAANVFESTEQSFIVLQSNMKRVALDQVPLKNLKIKLHDTTISTTNDSNITVYYNGTPQPSLSCQTGEIKYLKDERVLTYENGGVWKTYPGGKVMVSHPHIYSTTMEDTNFTTISVISINGRGSVGGKGVATIRMEHNNTTTNITETAVNLTLQINTTYSQQWSNYLNETGFTTTSLTETGLSATRNETRVIVAVHVVDVEIT